MSLHRLALVFVVVAFVLGASAVALARGNAHARVRASGSAVLQRDVSRYLQTHAGRRYAVRKTDVVEPGYAQVEATIAGRLVLLHFYRHRERWAFEAVNCLSACGTRVPLG